MKERFFRDSNVPDLDRLAKPLINYLQKHQHPNISIIVSEKGINMVEDLYFIPKDAYSDVKNNKSIFKKFSYNKKYFEDVVTAYEIKLTAAESKALANKFFAIECLYMIVGIAFIAIVGFLYVLYLLGKG